MKGYGFFSYLRRCLYAGVISVCMICFPFLFLHLSVVFFIGYRKKFKLYLTTKKNQFKPQNKCALIYFEILIT